ncbi:TadE/TadG family type IV pilus assembly protein [Burkholderia sp. S171]|uniref:TadE/TadG family type IV pilus assembly protein n=1 Tax=Burkholderia sp. S171 TaxID=1641860 RepID=UPI00131EB415|nr:TadE/TadG family type IV pilus assembly protein [Burkholderia sp. S171]
MPPSMKPQFLRTLSRLIADETGAIAMTFALLLVPMMLIVGGAVDYARMIQYRASLQNAVDQAAIAGAAVFSVPGQSALATQVATNYFNRTILPSSISITAPTVSTNSNGTINPALGSSAAYTVTVSATAKVSTTLLSLLIPSATITATATAGDPVVTANLTLGHVNSRACDGNSVYLYKVPLNASGNGYDYSSLPAWTTPGGLPTNNYYMIGSSFQSVPAGQVMPSFSANQPLGVALVNITNGNTLGNTNCGVGVTGANSYGAPNQNTQKFYSSLLLNNQSPSEQANSSYTITVNSTNSRGGSSITSVYNGLTLVPPPTQSSYNTLSAYLGINAPGSGYSNCTSTSSTAGSNTTTVYTCTTQYLTTKTSTTPNCSLYVQTGVTQSYVNALSNSSTAPAAALSNCFSTSGGGAAYAAPSCSQMSALSNSSSGIAPAVVFWWDDAGGVGPGEQYYSPSSHCSATSANGPGYGEDCQYKNNFFPATCTTSGGSGSGYTEVVLTQ